MTEVGLIKYVHTELPVQTWTRMLWALSYVPPEDVVDVFKYVTRKMPVINKDDIKDSDDERRRLIISLKLWICMLSTSSPPTLA